MTECDQWDRIVERLAAAAGDGGAVIAVERTPSSVVCTLHDDPEMRPREHEVFRGDVAGLRYVASEALVALPEGCAGPVDDPAELRFATEDDWREFYAGVCGCGRCAACRDISARFEEECREQQAEATIARHELEVGWL